MKRYKKIIAILLSIALIISTFGIFEVSATTKDTRYSPKYLQNGGFEKNVENYKFSSNYTQPVKTDVPYWDTTAYGGNGINGKLEFFKAGALHFSQSSTNKVVAQGEVAAELNADEISTIYQRIETVSGSTYTWGLDHRGRDTTDTMVLFIGPEQYKTVDGVKTAIDPSKPSKTGQDQFVKMTDWLKTQYGINYPAIGCSQKYTVYSKPFDKNGAFQNESTNANENFSMTPTDECTEEWSLWVISSTNNNTSEDEFKAVKGWSKYGTNCYKENENSYNDVINGAESRLGYDCTYTVPKGQTKTLFAFTSYSSGMLSNGSIKPDRTFGNLLDDINFKLYQPISSSITEGGTGGASTGNVSISSDIQNGNLFYTTVNDGQECTIHTKLTTDDSGHTFQGAYVTEYDDEGNPQMKFVTVFSGDTTGKTPEQLLELSRTYFMRDDYYQHEDGKTWDYFYTIKVDSPVHIHMMYTKAPYVLYDSNGGEPYKFGNNNLIGGNLVGFRDGFQKIEGVDTSDYYKDAEITEDGNGNLIEKNKGFYKSHSALPNKDWNKNTFADGSTVGARFLGWAIKDTDNKQVILNGNHQVTYDPATTGSGYVTFNNLDKNGEIIKDSAVAGLELDATHGVTLTAQWQFGYTAQAQTLVDSVKKTYENTALGGWVEETFITDRDNNVVDHKEDINGKTRIERTDAYAAVGETIIFRANADSANNYVFEGWYTIDENGAETRISTTPNLPISVKEGKSTTYYARFKTKTVPVVFHYSASGSKDDYVYYDANTDNKYGKFFQEVEYKGTANKPTGDSKNVQMWFTSPTERDQKYLFNFDTPITDETHLYASPSFTFNYTNYFRIKEPWILETYCTLKFDGDYINMKTDTNISDYNVYVLKGQSVDELKVVPSADSIKNNNKTVKTGKNINSQNVLFDKTTKSGKTFNRAGVKYDNSYIYEMKKPVWVMFDFTYKGITYTSPVKNRSLYNNIDVYKTSNAEQWFSTLPSDTQSEMRKAQIKLVDSIQAMYSAVSTTEITQPSEYYPSVAVSDLTYDSSTDGTYTFISTTAIRNIEPWGLKYTFSVQNNEMSSFTDYGAVVFTDKNAEYAQSGITVADIIGNENSVMFSKSSKNVYTNDKGEIEAYYINNMSATEFSKKTYVVFFVKNSNGTYYSSIVNNSYNDLATTENSEISNSIKSYSDALVNYFTLRDNAANQIA